jgi:hypothetical protein
MTSPVPPFAPEKVEEATSLDELFNDLTCRFDRYQRAELRAAGLGLIANLVRNFPFAEESTTAGPFSIAFGVKFDRTEEPGTVKVTGRSTKALKTDYEVVCKTDQEPEEAETKTQLEFA